MKLLKQTKKIELINGETIEVRKLSLRQLTSILEDLKSLPKELTQIEKMDESEIFEKLPMMLATIMPAIATLVVKAINNDDKKITEDFLLDECGLDDNLNVIKGLLEVNNIDQVFLVLKSIKGMSQKGNK